MHRIPGVQLPDTLRLTSVSSPAPGDDTGPYVLHVVPVKNLACPVCGRQLKTRVLKQLEIADLPLGDHPVKLKIATGIARCRRCQQTVSCELPAEFLWPDRPLTADLARYLQRHLGKVPLRVMSARTGLNVHQIRAVQRTQVDAVMAQVSPAATVQYLGLDEIFILRAKYLVAVDYSSKPKLISLVKAADLQKGRTSQSIPPDFFASLPEARVVSVDLNREQMAGVKKRWPEAHVVIDRRHLIEVINRELLQLVKAIVQARYGSFSDEGFGQQATRGFGDASSPYLALRGLILRRRQNLTPADAAQWLLLRSESSQGHVLYEAYQWREALHDLYDVDVDGITLGGALATWIDRFSKWQQAQPDGTLKSTRWAVSTYRQQIINYAQHRLTNAQTELSNAMIRRYLRMGHRYDARTLMALVNSTQLPPKRLTAAELQPLHWYSRADLTKLRPQREIVPAAPRLEQPPLPPLARSIQPEPWPWSDNPGPVPKPVRQTDNVNVDRVIKPRGTPKMPPEFALPRLVWWWLHSKLANKPHAERRVVEVLRQAPAKDRTAWSLLCAGQLSSALGLQVSAEQLQLWRATLLLLYTQAHVQDINAAERTRQLRFKVLTVADLQALPPPLLSDVANGWASLSERFASLDPDCKPSMDVLDVWLHLRYDAEAQEKLRTYRYGEGRDRTLWDKWRRAALDYGAKAEDIRQVFSYLDKLTPENMEALMQEGPFCWGTLVEWAYVQQHSALPYLNRFDPLSRLSFKQQHLHRFRWLAEHLRNRDD